MVYTVAGMSVNMMSGQLSQSRQKPSRVVLARGSVIAVAAGLSVVCGVVIPAPAWVVDIAWGCSLCLVAAMAVVGLGARDPAELSGFGPLMITAALVRILLNTATARLILHTDTAGTLAGAVGRCVWGISPAILLLSLPLVAGVAVMMVFRAAGRMTLLSYRCLSEVIPQNEADIEARRQAGLIDADGAADLRDRTLRQKGFYLNMAGVAGLLRCEVAVGALVVLVIVVGQLVMSTFDRSMSRAVVNMYASRAAGACIIILVPALAVALTSSRLVAGSLQCLSSAGPKRKWQDSHVVEIASGRTGCTEKVELLNPDIDASAEHGRLHTGRESVAEFEPSASDTVDSRRSCPAAEDSPEDYYTELARRLGEAGCRRRPVLLAAGNNAHLPVTVGINTAIRLAQEGASTLLIDAERGRNAVAAVFEIAPDDMRQPVETCVRNLWVWTLSDDTAKSDADQAVARTAAGYDFVLIYAPDLAEPEEMPAVAATAQNAVVFADDEYNGSLLEECLARAGCRVIEKRRRPRRN